MPEYLAPDDLVMDYDGAGSTLDEMLMWEEWITSDERMVPSVNPFGYWDAE